MRGWSLAVFVLTCLVVPTAWAGEVNTGDPHTQAIMHSLFEPLAKVLPLSFDEATFTGQAHRAEISGLLKELRDNAGALEQHAKGKERAFAFVAKSLQNDAKRLYHWFEHGDYDEARFTLHNMTDNCISCHSGLPESHKFPPADQFFKSVNLSSLHPLERAKYYVISRQFDAAISAYEGYFLQGDVPAASLASLGSFVDYLKLCANVKQDLSRPKRLIDTIAMQPNLRSTTRDQLRRWSKDLAELEKEGALQKTSLGEARILLNQGRDRMEFPRDHDGLMYYLTAGSILNRYVHSHPDRGQDVAEAYYMLGITESILGYSFWVSRTECYLESAIRLAPNAPFAPKALALLEENYNFNYTGSSGTHLPEDVKTVISELRGMMGEVRGGW